MKSKILVVDDEKLICWSLKKDLEKEGYEVHVAQSIGEGLSLFEQESPDAVLLDIQLPDGSGTKALEEMIHKNPFVSVIMVTANDEIRTAVECMQTGAFNYLQKPFDFEEIKVNLTRAIESQKLRKKVLAWESKEKGKYDFSNVIAESRKMKEVMGLVGQVIDSEASTILIEGESGTGKDLIARTIHYGGLKAQKPFVAINCAAIPDTLLESELFGYEKGAFTDAKQTKKGLVEEAAGGTLFLDEIGDMSSEMQAKLLHLIDQKKYRKVGGLKELTADIRLIAATNKNLKQAVSENKFREDLFYRLNVIPFQLPPLRERKEDVPALASFFIVNFNREFKKNVEGIHPEALSILLNYDWPGNIRELKNVIERAMILNQENQIFPGHIPNEINCHCVLKETHKSCGDSSAKARTVPRCIVGIPLEALEREAIAITLKETSGNQSQAAKLLGIGRDALRYKMQKFGLIESDLKESCVK